MAITTRQSGLLVQQDWTKIYQTFKEADFQSYDFETLRKTMIDYLRTYYPEDFNDFVDSSEYIALIDLIAFLGQSLAFRTDLNSRENFIDTAERRDSILKLAKLINYNPKRNIPASGYLKIDSVSTTETVTDSNGTDLSNLIISWNDPANDMWLEQFTTVLNGSLVSNQLVGKPGATQSLNGIKTDEYSIAIQSGVVPTYRFNSSVEGSNMSFEAVSATSANQNYVYEVDPKPKSRFNILYRNDNLGNSSVNTGFFVYFKQGQLQIQDFTLTQSIPNRVVNVAFNNINNNDVWLYSVNSKGQTDTQWTQVPAIAGMNIIYNDVGDRNIYQVNTKANDQVDLVFGDGSFGNMPQGTYRLYARVSNGLTYKITPDEIRSVPISINYVSRTGRIETLTLRVSLQYTVANASARETLDEIKNKAPQQYYSQNRMITAEDYNIIPYTNFSTILKAKAVNRTSSGISRFLDVLDRSGKYSSTNIFANDGYLYKQEYINNLQFTFVTNNDVYSVLYNQIKPILTQRDYAHFFYDKFTRFSPSGIKFKQTLVGSNSSTGSFVNNSNVVQQIGPITSTDLKYIVEGSLIKFTAPAGYYFNAQHLLKSGTAGLNDTTVLYASVISVSGSNTVVLNQAVPTDAIVSEIIPVLKNDLSDNFVNEMFLLVKSYKNFGIRYDIGTQSWQLIEQQNLGGNVFDLTTGGNTSGTGSDTSWIIKFIYDGVQYQVYYRGLQYVFESATETKFYFDPAVRAYDSSTGLTLSDQIKVLRINHQPDSSDAINQELTWYIYKNIVESDGYTNPNKILVTYSDINTDGIPDNPDLFTTIVDPATNSNYKFVYFKETVGYQNYITFKPVSNNTIISDFATLVEIQKEIENYIDQQIFYAYTENKFYQLTIDTVTGRSLSELNTYIAKIGRQDLSFQYRHNSPNNRRVDPSPNNIMDLYILTKTYATDYQAWLVDYTGTLSEPDVPTSEELKTAYNELENYKALSDTVIYNSAKLKPIFGSKAEVNLRAKFKVVKNPNVVISDNDVKSSVVAALNNYFSLNNWDFGETFYFSELSAYLHRVLTPNVASVIIVPEDNSKPFGNLYQINAEPNEIIVNAATVDNVEIISAITAAQLNQSLSGLNTYSLIG